MRRREFIPLLGGAAAAWPGRALTQQERLRRIGVLDWSSAGDRFTYDGVIAALGELGYVDGRNIAVDYRGVDGDIQRAARLAAELAGNRVDLIIALTTAIALATKAATRTIPIVFIAADPVAIGLVASLARPGGNLTGVSLVLPDVAAKWLELLREVMPQVERVAFLESTLETNLPRQPVEASAARLGIAVQTLPIGGARDLEAAFASAVAGRASAVVVQTLLLDHRAAIAGLALRYRLPWISERVDAAQAGALLAYGPDRPAIYARLASLVDRILRGSSPSELPVERPTRFTLVVNLRAARVLGIAVPPTLLAHADEVIE